MKKPQKSEKAKFLSGIFTLMKEAGRYACGRGIISDCYVVPINDILSGLESTGRLADVYFPKRNDNARRRRAVVTQVFITYRSVGIFQNAVFVCL